MSRFFSTTATKMSGAAKPWGTSRKPVMTELKKLINKETSRATEKAQEYIEINPRFAADLKTSKIYDPFDFSIAKKNLIYATSNSRRLNLPFQQTDKHGKCKDVFRNIRLNPMNLYTFAPILTQYVSETGRIVHRDVNATLKDKTHKKLSKAIHRARAAGIMSNTSRNGITLPNDYSYRFNN